MSPLAAVAEIELPGIGKIGVERAEAVIAGIEAAHYAVLAQSPLGEQPEAVMRMRGDRPPNGKDSYDGEQYEWYAEFYDAFVATRTR